MKELAESIVMALVDCPEEVKVSEITGGQTTVLELSVAKEDLGKVIGKQGRTALALRTILNCGSAKMKKKGDLGNPRVTFDCVPLWIFSEHSTKRSKKPTNLTAAAHPEMIGVRGGMLIIDVVRIQIVETRQRQSFGSRLRKVKKPRNGMRCQWRGKDAISSSHSAVASRLRKKRRPQIMTSLPQAAIKNPPSASCRAMDRLLPQ